MTIRGNNGNHARAPLAVSLFSGIGGLDLAAEASGVRTVVFSETDVFASRILKKRWPGVENVGDIRRFANRTLRELGGMPYEKFKTPTDVGEVDVVHGGFPCQDLSVAGKQRGLGGERSGLWFEMLRVVEESKPRFVVAENVRGSVNLALDVVRSGLERAGYEVGSIVVPACLFGAPHKRERLFVLGVRHDVADAYKEGLQGGQESGGVCEMRKESSDEQSRGGSESKLWPTPRASDGRHGGPGQRGGKGDLMLPSAVHEAEKLWPTPQSRDYRSGDKPDGIRDRRKDKTGWSRNLNDVASPGGQLSPLWVENLMNFPIGWTDPDCDEPEPWPGWPMGLWAGNWPTPQCFDATAGDLKGKEYTGKNRHALKLGNCINSQTGQYSYEPPRTCSSLPNRASRIKALGNSVVPAQAAFLFEIVSHVLSVLDGIGAESNQQKYSFDTEEIGEINRGKTEKAV